MNNFLQRLFLLFVLIGVGPIFSQETTVKISPTKDALLYNLNSTTSNTNYGSSTTFKSSKWTSGTWYNKRSLIEFDLASIPKDAVITEAVLTLTGVKHWPLRRSNESYFYRVSESWSETGVTWNNQPPVVDDGKVYLKGSTKEKEVYQIDLVEMVQSWVDGYYANNGIMLKLADEDTRSYTEMYFASSDHSDTKIRPRLDIKYVLPSKVTLYNNKDSYIKYSPNKPGPFMDNNYGREDLLYANQWTEKGEWFNIRSLIEFDLSSIPVGAEILKARLSFRGGDHMDKRSNASALHLITKSWDEDRVTWRNQPSYDANYIKLEETHDLRRDYYIDLKDHVTAWYNNDYSNYGLLLKLLDEAPSKPDYAQLSFASSDHRTTQIRPVLEVYYVIPLVPTLSSIPLTSSDLGEVSVQVSGGEKPYSYLWDNGKTSSVLYDCWPGEYSVTVTDKKGDRVTETIYLDSPVHWINTNNVNVQNSRITKNKSSSLWDSGAESASFFRAGKSGQMFYKAETQSTQRAFGLAEADRSIDLNGLNYAIYFDGTKVSIYERGTFKRDLGSYGSNDIFQIIIEGSEVKYYKNDKIEQTTSIGAAVDLVPRVVLKTNQSYFTDVRSSSDFYSNIAINTENLGEGYSVDVISEGITSKMTTGSNSAFWVNPISKAEDRSFNLIFYDLDGKAQSQIRFDMDNTYQIKDVEIQNNSAWVNMPTEMFSSLDNSISVFSSSDQTSTVGQTHGVQLSLEHGELLSPNGDGNYDVLEVTGSENVSSYQITIYNTQGAVVYSSSNINIDWNGISSSTGSLVPVGTYRYRILINGIEFNGLFNINY